jgi:hypothetical protein
MAYQKIGRPKQAVAELAVAREIIGDRFPEGLTKGLPISGDSAGLWHDWVETLLLLNEAAFEVEGRSPVPLIQEMGADSSQ